MASERLRVRRTRLDCARRRPSTLASTGVRAARASGFKLGSGGFLGPRGRGVGGVLGPGIELGGGGWDFWQSTKKLSAINNKRF